MICNFLTIILIYPLSDTFLTSAGTISLSYLHIPYFNGRLTQWLTLHWMCFLSIWSSHIYLFPGWPDPITDVLAISFQKVIHNKGMCCVYVSNLARPYLSTRTKSFLFDAAINQYFIQIQVNWKILTILHNWPIFYHLKNCLQFLDCFLSKIIYTLNRAVDNFAVNIFRKWPIDILNWSNEEIILFCKINEIIPLINFPNQQCGQPRNKIPFNINVVFFWYSINF